MLTILIPGLILVALMIWASTRIKRSAAQAYEREVIDTPEFSLVKPEGFLAPVDPSDGTVFSAYSKEYGRGDAERLRHASVEMRRFDDADLETVCERAKVGSSAIVEEQKGVIGQDKCANIVVARSVDGVPVETHLKIITAPTAVYQLSVTVLPEHKDELSRRIDEMLSSFSLK